MAGRPPSEIGVQIRETLYQTGPRTISELRAELNKIRRVQGKAKVYYDTVARMVREAENQGLVERVKGIKKAPSDRLDGHPELDLAYQYKVVMAKYKSPKWKLLTRLVAHRA